MQLFQWKEKNEYIGENKMYDDCILPYKIEFCAKINQLKFRLILRSIQSYNEEKKYDVEIPYLIVPPPMAYLLASLVLPLLLLASSI